MSRWAPRLLAVSGEAVTGDADRFAAWARMLAASRVDAVQLRCKAGDDRTRVFLAAELRRRLRGDQKLLVNGRADIALAVGADGVHLPTDSLPAAAIRDRWPALIVGRSTHHREEVEAAARDGLDYVVFGPVYATPSKERFGPPRGASALAEVAGIMPVVAIGGVDAEQVAELAASGAAGVAAIRALAEPGELSSLGRAVDAATWSQPS